MRGLLILALILVSTAVGCDGYTLVKGRVVDPTEKPIFAAEVKLIYKPDDARYRHANIAKTDKEGRFVVGSVHSPSKKLPIRLEVNKEGFTEPTESLASMASYQKEIVLQPAKK